MDEKKLYSVREAADFLDMAPFEVRRAMSSGGLSAESVAGRWVISVEELNDFAGRRKAAEPAEPEGKWGCILTPEGERVCGQLLEDNLETEKSNNVDHTADEMAQNSAKSAATSSGEDASKIGSGSEETPQPGKKSDSNGGEE